ncbi:MAG: glutathione S-transferase family protein, partial [Nannocystaceae bacterium]
MPILYSLYFSPWSLKARWALDHHGVEYEQREYLPVIGEPLMRLRLRNFTAKITVPILFGTGAPLTDSFAIARYAETIGSGPKLFPPGRGRDIEAWNQRGETALAAGRLLSMAEILNDPEA